MLQLTLGKRVAVIGGKLDKWDEFGWVLARLGCVGFTLSDTFSLEPRVD